MKHIKKLSERLYSDTYKSAAKKLKSYGHNKRVVDLENWGKKKEIEENNKIKANMIESIKSIGTYELFFNYENYRGEFYICLDFDPHMFLDRYAEWIGGDSSDLHLSMSIGVIPLNDDEFKNTEISADRGGAGKDGVYWIGDLTLHLGEFPKSEYPDEPEDWAYVIYRKDDLSPKLPHPINPKGVMYLECWEHNFVFVDRRNAARFRKSIIDIFKGNIEYKETPENPGGLKGDVMDFLCSERPIFDIYEFETFIKSLSRANINRFFRD